MNTKGIEKSKGHIARLLSISTVSIVDADPDLSYLGKFSDSPDVSDGDILVKHSQDRREYRYFHAANCTNEVEAEQNHEVMSDYGNGWCCLGIKATASVYIGGTVQEFTSGGLWGMESNDGGGIADAVNEQLAELIGILENIGILTEEEADTVFNKLKGMDIDETISFEQEGGK